MSKMFSENDTPISGQPIGGASVSSDIADGMRRHDANPLAWESATDAVHNNEYSHEYKPIMRGPNKK
jgi:hypothetical protein